MNLNDIAANISSYVTIVSVIPILYTAYEISLGKRRRHKKWHDETRTNIGGRPSVLIVTIDKNITVQVTGFLTKDENLKNIPSDRIFVIHWNRRLQVDDMPAFHHDLKDKVHEISQSGANQLHVFISGPLFIAAMVGAELANFSNVLIYHQNNNDGGYVNFGRLKHTA